MSSLELLFLILLNLSSQPAGQSANAPAVLLRVQGDVSFRMDTTGTWQKGTRGQKLFPKNEIKTGEKSTAIVVFTDGSVLRLNEKSSVRIRGTSNADGKYDQRDLQINQGTLGFDVKANPQKQFRFSTVTATAAIKGTEGVVALGDSTVAFSLLDSESPADDVAEITFSDGKKEKIGIGQQFKLAMEKPKKGIKLGDLDEKPPKFGDLIKGQEKMKLTSESMRELSQLLVKRGAITQKELDDVGFKLIDK
jgi:hypothetical protein